MSPVGRAAGYGDNPITPPRSSWKGGESSMCRAPVPWYLPSPADARSSSVDGGKNFLLRPTQQVVVTILRTRSRQSPRLSYVDVVRSACPPVLSSEC